MDKLPVGHMHKGEMDKTFFLFIYFPCLSPVTFQNFHLSNVCQVLSIVLPHPKRNIHKIPEVNFSDTTNGMVDDADFNAGFLDEEPCISRMNL